MVVGKHGRLGAVALQLVMVVQKQGQENVHFQNLLLKDTTVKEMILSYKPVTLIHVQVKNLINLI